MNVDGKDVERGVYHKFNVSRTDGRSSPGEKHHGCQYFVLDLEHDPHAVAALVAYAESCAREFPTLAADLRIIAESARPGRYMSAMIAAYEDES